MTAQIIKWLSYASVVSPLLPLLFLSTFWKKQPRQNRILIISLLLSLVADVISSVLGAHGIQNLFVLNMYCILALPATMLFYQETLVKRELRILTHIFTIVFLIVALFLALDQGLIVANHNTWTLSSVLLAIASLLFVGDLNLMDETTFTKNRFHQTNILLNTSLAFYHIMTTIVFLSADYVFTHVSPEDFNLFWGSQNVAHILKNIGFAVAFYLSSKRYGAWMDQQKS